VIGRGSLAATAVVASCLTGSPARSDDGADEPVWGEQEPPPVYLPALRPPPRKLIGFDFGLGVYDGLCSGCVLTGGLSVGAHGGVQVTGRLAVIGDASAVLHLLPADSAEDRGVSAHAIAAAAARVWLSPTLWVQGGPGAGFLGVAGPGDALVIGPAFTLAVGSELRHRSHSGIDLALRGGASRFSGDPGATIYNVAATVGYHWN
jgi:hypothetical protein